MDIGLIKYNTAVTGAGGAGVGHLPGRQQPDFPHSLVVNAQNELVLLGSTSLDRLPHHDRRAAAQLRRRHVPRPFRLTGSRDYKMPNGSDLVVTRLSADWQRAAGQHLPGRQRQRRRDAQRHRHWPPTTATLSAAMCCWTAAGNVYIASNTSSPNFPGMSAGLQRHATAAGSPMRWCASSRRA